jgi:hypothetical protein
MRATTMKLNMRCALFAALAFGLALPASAGELKLTMKDGRVTIIADEVPLRQILLEWARVGQTRIVNAEKLNGPAVTLQLIDAPEKDALDILLRSASGYIAAPRPIAMANAATYDRITIMATSRAPAASPMSASASAPTFQRPPQPIDDSDEPVVNVTMPQQPQPYVPPMQPQPYQPQPYNPNGNNNNQVIVNPANLVVPPGGFNAGQQPQGPLTAPRPGMVIPPAGANGVPNPYQPTVVRPPGGGGGEGGF